MPSWSSTQSQVVGGKIEHFCNCECRLTVQTETTRKNPGKRFITCFVCGAYEFLDDDLPSEYYKDLLYGMYPKHKRLKKNVDYQQFIDVLALYKSMLEEELNATKSKLKLYRLFFIMLGSFLVICVGFGQSQHVLVSALGLDLVSAMGLHFMSALGHLVHQTI
ncbi:hypothetical protein Tco_0077429 [Tanacetum coccineum]